MPHGARVTTRDDITFSLLGTVQVRDAGVALELGPARDRALLAVLLCRVNEVVCPGQLVDAVWDTQPPGSGRRVIPSYIYRIRKALSPVCDRARIETAAEGYVLRTAPEKVDKIRFERVAFSAGARAYGPGTRGADEEAFASVTEALALWRGEPFTGLPGPVLAAERAKLQEQRLALIEERLELDLECGRHARAVAELEALCVAHPWRERFAAQLMVALSCSGRQADALAVYDRTRDALREALGADPGAELATAHRTVLRCGAQPRGTGKGTGSGGRTGARSGAGTGGRDGAGSGGRDGAGDGDGPGSGAARKRAGGVRVPGARPPRDLPAEPLLFVGREAETATLLAAVPAADAVGVLTVDGMPGVGKTALALRVAHRLAAHHPDGALHLDLTGLGTSEALRRLLTAVGFADRDIRTTAAERGAQWRSALAGRRVVVHLDNPGSSAQVRALLPGTPGCTAVVSGRHRLCSLSVTAAVTLSPLDGDGSRHLLARLVGEARTAAEPRAADTVLRVCAGLPLAIVLAAGVLRRRTDLTMTGLAARLADPLRALRVAPDSLWAALAPALAELRPPALRTLRSLAAQHPHDGTTRQAYGAREAGSQAEAEVDELADASLLTRRDDGTVNVHPLVAACASAYAPES